MRFIILALALIGAALYISNPQAFGAKKKFQLSENGRVVSREPDRARFDFTKIGDFGVELYEKFIAAPDDSASTQAIEVARTKPALQTDPENSQVLSAVGTPESLTYEGQLAAISAALHENPEATAAQMQAATQACLSNQAPDPLANYFSGLVQVVAQTSQLPQAQQVESFKSLSAPLTQALKAWLQFLPEDQRAVNTAVLQDWAARPKDLVACHQAWLGIN